MATKFLEFKDGVIVEIGGPSDVRKQMHTASADQIDTTMDIVGTMLSRILVPIRNSFAGLQESLNVPVAVDSADVELGLSFSAEGNLFVTKSKAEGALKVKITFKPISKQKAPVSEAIADTKADVTTKTTKGNK